KQHTYQDRILVDPNILAGKPMIKGTRIPVKVVLKRLAENLNPRTLFEEYPRLTEEDVKATLNYAEQLVEQEEHPHQPPSQPKPSSVEEVLSLAGAWGERNWEEVEKEL